jgi:asparagine synthetase B (glutamine-hydrolysing)
MCGIVGELSFDERPVSAAALDAMTRSITHRGPDHG